MTDSLAQNLMAAAVFALLGIVVFLAAFFLVDRLTPGDLWEELMKKDNTGLGVLMGGMAVGLAIIIAAAIH